MENQPKVSIIVPLYNQERYFEACLRSVCQQTYTNLEVIVVNDGSSDNSPLIAKRYAQKDNRLIVIDKQNEGTAFARRDGYLRSTGDFIAFVDNDDLLPKKAIENLSFHILDKNADLVLGSVIKKLGFINKYVNNYYSFPYHQIVRQPELFEKYYIGFYNNSIFPVNIWGRLYRKSIVDQAYKATELFSNSLQCMAGDEYFNMKLFPFIRSMYRTEDVAYYYRYGGTVDGFNRFFPEVLALSDIRYGLLDQYKCDDAQEYLFKEYVACFYYHAQQLLEYRKTDKCGVIDYFKNELQTRKLVPAMIDFFSKSELKSRSVILILERDFEGMYNYANELMRERKGSLKYKAKRALNSIFEFTNDITVSAQKIVGHRRW